MPMAGARYGSDLEIASGETADDARVSGRMRRSGGVTAGDRPPKTTGYASLLTVKNVLRLVGFHGTVEITGRWRFFMAATTLARAPARSTLAQFRLWLSQSSDLAPGLKRLSVAGLRL